MKKPTLLTYRRTVQIGIALAFIIIPWLNHMRISFVYGNFLAFHLYKLPLADPLAVLQVTLKNSYLSGELLLGAAIALVLAAVLGSVFCSWICPYGLISEWGQRWAGAKRRRHEPSRRRITGFRVKLVLFLLGLAGFFLFATTPVLNQLSLPAWYSRIFQFWFEQWHLSLAIVALPAIVGLEIMWGRRFWCRSICPQSVLITLARQLIPARLAVRFDTDACLCKNQKHDPCSQACSLDLDPKTVGRLPEWQCTNCGDCVVACQKRGKALALRFGRPKHRRRS